MNSLLLLPLSLLNYVWGTLCSCSSCDEDFSTMTHTYHVRVVRSTSTSFCIFLFLSRACTLHWTKQVRSGRRKGDSSSQNVENLHTKQQKEEHKVYLFFSLMNIHIFPLLFHFLKRQSVILFSPFQKRHVLGITDWLVSSRRYVWKGSAENRWLAIN